MEPENRFQGKNSASLCSLAGRYDNPIPIRFLAPIDCLKISAQDDSQPGGIDSWAPETFTNTCMLCKAIRHKIFGIRKIFFIKLLRKLIFFYKSKIKKSSNFIQLVAEIFVPNFEAKTGALVATPHQDPCNTVPLSDRSNLVRRSIWR